MSKTQETASDDDLDWILDVYTKEAADQTRRAQLKEASRSQPRSMAGIRAAGLAQPLGAENKGYLILKKLGYQDGSGLGRGDGGRAEPVPLDIKAGRAGLGVDEKRRRDRSTREQQEEIERLKRARLDAATQQRFQAATRSDYGARQAVKHLRGAWRVAEELDERFAASQPPSPSSEGRAQGPDGDTAGACPVHGKARGGHRDGDPRCQGHADRLVGAVAKSAATTAERSAVLQHLLARLPTLAALLQEQQHGEEQQPGGGAGQEPQHGCGRAAGAGTERGAQGPLDDLGVGGDVGAAPSRQKQGDNGAGVVSGSCGDGEDQCCSTEGIRSMYGGGKSVPDGSGRSACAGRDFGGSNDGKREYPREEIFGEGGSGDGARSTGVPFSSLGAMDAASPALEEQLAVLLSHLRDRHLYCYFCGCQYDSAEDLAANCPGLTEDLH